MGSNVQTSSDLQEIVLSSILKDQYILGKVKNDIQVMFFDKLSYKLIYKSLLYYYNKYSQMPTLQSLSITIDDLYTTEYGSKKDIQTDLVNLYNIPINNEEFVIDQITRFIKRHRVEDVLSTYLPRIKNGEAISIDKLGDDLSNSVAIDLKRSNAFRLSDTNSFSDVRRDSVGSESNPTIIKSKFSAINNSLLFKGYKLGDVVIVCAKPGCFTGDTKVMTLDGETHTLEELYNSDCKGIYGYNTKESKISTGLYSHVQLSKYTDDLVYIEIDYDYKVKCTPDHLFMMRDGSYKMAKDLSVDDSLMPIRREYRSALNSGADLVDKSLGYECVVDGFSNWNYTHRITAESIEHSEDCTIVHHIDKNKLNNYPTNLKWMNSYDHKSLHGKDSKGRSDLIGNHMGKSTEFTSEYISERNKENWKNPEYREFMKSIISESSKNSKLVKELNGNPEFQFNTRKCKVLSYINYMIHKFGINNITVDNFDELSDSITEYKQHVHLTGVSKVYNCSIGHPKGSRYDYPDYNELKSKWNFILNEAYNYNHKVTGVMRYKEKEPVPVYDIVNSEIDNNFALALSDTEGIFVHNCGKTMFMVNELRNASMLGFNVLHLFIGDMTKYDGFIRYASGISNINQDEIVQMSEMDQMNLIKKCNYNGHFDRVAVESYAAGEINVNQMIDDVFKIQDELKMHFDMIAVDYPDNLIKESEMMYESGGEIYNKLSFLATRNKCVVIAGSQPKQSYWNSEIIPLDGCAESSKKQHVIDIMITLGRPINDCPLLTGFLAKVRRGTVGTIFRTKTEFEKANMDQISEMDYARIKADYDGSNQQ